jgi:hypothetical protein
MTFAKRVYLGAGIYGLIFLLPLYFLEARTGRDYPPPITHPEYYYGFIGVAVAWQLVFLVMSRDPIRYRALMIPSMVEKVVPWPSNEKPVWVQSVAVLRTKNI